MQGLRVGGQSQQEKVTPGSVASNDKTKYSQNLLSSFTFQ